MIARPPAVAAPPTRSGWNASAKRRGMDQPSPATTLRLRERVERECFSATAPDELASAVSAVTSPLEGDGGCLGGVKEGRGDERPDMDGIPCSAHGVSSSSGHRHGLAGAALVVARPRCQVKAAARHGRRRARHASCAPAGTPTSSSRFQQALLRILTSHAALRAVTGQSPPLLRTGLGRCSSPPRRRPAERAERAGKSCVPVGNCRTARLERCTRGGKARKVGEREVLECGR